MLWPELGPGILEAPRNPAGSNFEPGGLKQVLEGLGRSAGSRFESAGPQCVLEALARDFSRGLLQVFLSQVA